MTKDLLALIEGLSLEKKSDAHYIGHYIPAIPNHVFGGQVVAQSIRAALNEIEDDKSLHSLHSYFLDRGHTDKPFNFHVKKLRDGRSFSVRQVDVYQDERQIYTATLSFHRIEDGVSFQHDMPQVDGPDQFIEEADRWNNHPIVGNMPERKITFRPLNVRHTGPVDWFTSFEASPETGIWIKTRDQISDDPKLHQTLLGYFSDTFLYAASLRPHGLTFQSPNLQGASLDHTLWIHDHFRADDWLFYQHSGIWSGRARGLNIGKFFTRDGRHVASTSQEGLMRVKQA
ncbi:MAG: thioesterase family protein [Methylocystaceae bacterium]|nr:thioesterase family protein [Methylocystaceae bacterium]